MDKNMTHWSHQGTHNELQKTSLDLVTTRQDLAQTRYRLDEVIGCFEEYKAMRCLSLLARLETAINRARTYAEKQDKESENDQ